MNNIRNSANIGNSQPAHTLCHNDCTFYHSHPAGVAEGTRSFGGKAYDIFAAFKLHGNIIFGNNYLIIAAIKLFVVGIYRPFHRDTICNAYGRIASEIKLRFDILRSINDMRAYGVLRIR